MKKFAFIILTCLFIVEINAQPTVVKADSFYSSSVQLQLKYTIILPANYGNTKKHYPVVYILHGHSGNYTSWITYAQLPIKLATQYECIIILPDAGNSWYINWTGQTDANHINGKT